MSFRTRTAVGVVAIAAALGLAVALAASAGVGPWRPPPPAPGAPVLEFVPGELVRPQRLALPEVIEFSGPLVAPSTAVVRAKAAGTLLALGVAEGSRVRAGQTLGALDLAEIDGRVAERSAGVAAARVQLAQAERTHAANRELADRQFISPVALEGSRAAVDAARAQLQAAEAQLATGRVALRQAALVAPIDGWVAKRHALPGERVSPEQPLLTLVDIARLELAAGVAPHEVARLQVGMLVTLQVQGLATAVTGRLERIAPAAEAGTRAIGVAVGIDNRDERLRAGAYAMARVAVADDTLRLTLPMSALTIRGADVQAWVLEHGVLARRAVIVGRRDEPRGLVEVLGGVDAGTQVLAARYDQLAEGARAIVVAGAPAAASAPTAR